jgi:hypothetical protein
MIECMGGIHETVVYVCCNAITGNGNRCMSDGCGQDGDEAGHEV